MHGFPVRTFFLAIALMPLRLLAMNMPVYDLDSKVYLSTDIVVVQISIDEAKHKNATVQETLLGTLPVGTRLDQIDGYLSYFAKIDSGVQLVLFLDSRPRKLDFLYKEFEKAPYAIVPSGVELVDPFGHVHSYYQPRNPGGYFPAGYSWFHTDKPLNEDDARKFPTLSEEKQKIAEAIRLVEPARTVLRHESTANDVPRLLHFVDTTSSDSSDCAIRTASAVREDAMQHIKDRNDPDLLLHAQTIAGQAERLDSAQGFLAPTENISRSADEAKAFKAKRVEFLLNAVADKRRPAEERRTALDFLMFNSGWGHPYSGFAKVLPIDAPALAPIASRVVEISRSIFSDPGDDSVLRGMCLRFLDLDDPANVSLAKAVYKAAKSDALRFEIEDVLLGKSDQLFLELAPPSGGGASIVGVSPKSGCAPAEQPEPMFFSRTREVGHQNAGQQPGTQVRESTVLIDRSTGKTFDVDAKYRSDGQFAVEALDGVPVGEYWIAIQFSRDGGSIGHGYGLRVAVIEESGHKRIAIDTEASRERPQLASF